MITLLSPAKINLFLKVVRKRPDGYHDIVSRFQTISFADTLTLKKSHQNVLTCSDPKIPLNAENTVVRALELFLKETKLPTRFEIHIQKNIPAGAGLGGGSSNAATALFGLNRLLNNPLSLKQLRDIGKEVGSDVPFFLSSGQAVCKGRGEIIEEAANTLSGTLFVIMPPYSLSTKDVYQTLDVSTLQKRELPAHDAPLEFFNDLEDPAFKLAPELKKLKDQLSKTTKNPVFMTGSGSALIMLGDLNPGSLQDCTIHKAHFISRNGDSWYVPHSAFNVLKGRLRLRLHGKL